jgi:hypothetical protein
VDKQTGDRLIAEGKELIIAELQLPGPLVWTAYDEAKNLLRVFYIGDEETPPKFRD